MKLAIYILSCLLTLSVLSCSKKEGEPGPAGADANLNKQGTMNGTVTYKTSKGDSVSYSFNYQYYTSDLDENEFNYDDVNGTGYVISVSRIDAADYNNNFNLNFIGNMDPVAGGGFSYVKPSQITLSFGFIKETDNGLFIFQNAQGDGYSEIDINEFSDSEFELSNYSFNAATGVLMFDYTINLAPYDIYDDYRWDDDVSGIIKGSVNVTLKRNPYNTDYNNQQQQPPLN